MHTTKLIPALEVPETRTRSYRWVILALVWIAFLMSTVCRLAWGTVAASVGSSLGLQVGWLGIFVTSFYAGYVVSNVFSGVASDVFGARLTLTLSLCGLGILSVGFSLTPNAWVGLTLQALMGMAAGADYAAAIKLIRTWFSGHERGRAVGLFMTSGSFAVVVTNVSVPVMTQHLGWQNSYRILGGATIVLALICAVMVRNSALTVPSTAVQTEKVSLKVLASDRSFLLLCLAGCGGIWGTVGFLAWANALMIKGHNVSVVDAGIVSAIFGVGAVVCKPIIGIVYDRVFRLRKNITIGALVFFAATLLFFGHLTQLKQFQIAAPFMGIAAYLYSPLLIALVAEQSEVKFAGSAAGVSNAIWQLGGMMSPLVVGWTYASTKSFENCFFALAVGPVLAVVCVLLVKLKK